MHVHAGAIHGAVLFLIVLLFGTLWRLGAMHLQATSNGTAKKIGQAMAVQY